MSRFEPATPLHHNVFGFHPLLDHLHAQSLGNVSCAAACVYLHLWVPSLLWEIELTNKRRHAQHCWAELITFTIRILYSGFVDIHHTS